MLASRAEFLHTGSGGGAAPAQPAVSAPKGDAKAAAKPDAVTVDRGARALSLLLTELAKLKDPSVPAEKTDKQGPEAQMLAQVLATAALESKTNADLARHLERVKKEGVATPMGQVFRTLGWGLPAGARWARTERRSTPRPGAS